MNWASFINWAALTEWLLGALAKCQSQGATPEEQENAIRNPSIRFRLKVNRKVEREALAKGMTKKQWRANKEKMLAAVYAEGEKASKAEVRQLILQAKSAEPVDDEDDLFGDED